MIAARRCPVNGPGSIAAQPVRHQPLMIEALTQVLANFRANIEIPGIGGRAIHGFRIMLDNHSRHPSALSPFQSMNALLPCFSTPPPQASRQGWPQRRSFQAAAGQPRRPAAAQATRKRWPYYIRLVLHPPSLPLARYASASYIVGVPLAGTLERGGLPRYKRPALLPSSRTPCGYPGAGWPASIQKTRTPSVVSYPCGYPGARWPASIQKTRTPSVVSYPCGYPGARWPVSMAAVVDRYASITAFMRCRAVARRSSGAVIEIRT